MLSSISDFFGTEPGNEENIDIAPETKEQRKRPLQRKRKDSESAFSPQYVVTEARVFSSVLVMLNPLIGRDSRKKLTDLQASSVPELEAVIRQQLYSEYGVDFLQTSFHIQYYDTYFEDYVDLHDISSLGSVCKLQLVPVGFRNETSNSQQNARPDRERFMLNDFKALLLEGLPVVKRNMKDGKRVNRVLYLDETQQLLNWRAPKKTTEKDHFNQFRGSPSWSKKKDSLPLVSLEAVKSATSGLLFQIQAGNM